MKDKRNSWWTLPFMAIPVLMSLAHGMIYFVQIWLTLIIPIIGLVAALAVARRGFGGLVPTYVCLFPKDLARDAWRRYQWLMSNLTLIWLSALLVLADCIWALKTGLGDQWNPLTRTLHIGKTGPYSEYTIFDAGLTASGIVSLSALVWYPMYAFFEWLTVRTEVAKIMGGAA